MTDSKTPKLRESDIQRTCEDILKWDGWHIFRLEQNYSERKRKVVGEEGAADALCIRYSDPPHSIMPATRAKNSELMFIEWKRPQGFARPKQHLWHDTERARGALTLIAGEDFTATIEGFRDWYAKSGLMRGVHCKKTRSR